MCRFASFVLTRDAEFWTDSDSESHERIIADHRLNADGARGPNVLCIELSPVVWDDLSTWAYRVDQDVLPEWTDAIADERRARAALARRFAAGVPRSFGGNLYLVGCTGLTALPDGLSVGGNLDLVGCTGLTGCAIPAGVLGRVYR